MSCQLIGSVVSQDYNRKLLDMNAETFSNRLWSGERISGEDIQEDLKFLHNHEDVKDKVGSFKELYEKKIILMPDAGFISFANACKEIYEKNDSKTGVAVIMFFEEVSKKYKPMYTKLQKLKALHEQEEKNRQTGTNKWTSDDEAALDLVRHADRRPPLGVKPVETY